MATTLQPEADPGAAYIEYDPSKPGIADARTIEGGVPVWALIGHYQTTGRDAAYVAKSYRLHLETVNAALAYYQQHRAVIDARLEANAA